MKLRYSEYAGKVATSSFICAEDRGKKQTSQYLDTTIYCAAEMGASHVSASLKEVRSDRGDNRAGRVIDLHLFPHLNHLKDRVIYF